MNKRPYAVLLVFEVMTDGRHNHFDEQLRYLDASDEAEAFENARAFGEAEAGMFSDRSGAIVKWEFIAVSDVYALLRENGELIFSRSTKEEDATSYRRYLLARQEEIRSKPLLLA